MVQPTLDLRWWPQLWKVFFYSFSLFVNFKCHCIDYKDIHSNQPLSINGRNTQHSIAPIPSTSACHTLGVILAPDGQDQHNSNIWLMKLDNFVQHFLIRPF